MNVSNIAVNLRAPVKLLSVFGLAIAGCSVGLVQRAQMADGVIEFLAGNPGEVGVPIERLTGQNGRIESAHLVVRGRRAFVSGYVSRSLGHLRAPKYVNVK